MHRTNKYITNTRVSMQLNLEKELDNIVTFLAAHREMIASADELSTIFSSRSLVASPISNIFTKCICGKYINEFATIANPSPDVVKMIPDIMIMPAIVIDLMQSNKASLLSAYPELYNKLVVNITHLVKVNKSLGTYETSALHELHSMYVKALLVRHYFASGESGWLTPILQQYVIRTYSMFIGSLIARQTNLNYNELNNIAIIFAFYMCQMLAGTNADISCPPQFLNINFLGNRSDLMYTAGVCKEYFNSSGMLTIDSICQLLSDNGPARLKGYNFPIFLRHCSQLGSYNDITSTIMAFEYPPYWVWMLLLAQSGVQMRTMSSMLKQYNLNNSGTKFANDLIHYLTITQAGNSSY